MKSLILISGLLTFSLFGKAQDVYNYENSKLFADHLFTTRQYNLAIVEYERLLYFSNEKDSIQVRLLQAYYNSGNISGGLLRVGQFYKDFDIMPSKSALEYSKMLIKEKSYANADSFLFKSKTIPQADKWLLLASISAFNSNWKQAQAHTNSVVPKTNAMAVQYNAVFNEAFSLKQKSPLLAASLSAIVPGSGKIYSSYWKDGIISFIMVAGAGLQSYKAFKDKGSRSARGWIFASVTTGFYLGNIYGSQKAAKDYNHRRFHKIISKVENIFNANY